MTPAGPRRQVILSLFSGLDFLAVYGVDATTGTVLGVDAHLFAVFGEAANDVMHQIKRMPLLVLAAQVRPLGSPCSSTSTLVANGHSYH